MAWQLVGSTSDVIAAGAGTENITLPGPPIAGDLVLVATAADISCANCITSSGYTVPENGTGANPGANFGYKVMGGTPDTVVTIDQDATILRSVVVQVWRGGRATILDAAWITPLTGTSANPNAGAIVSTTPNALIVQVAFLDDDDTTVSSAPTNYNNTITTNTGQASTTIGATVAIATRILAAAASEDAGNWTMGSSDAWTAGAIAFAVAALGPAAALTENVRISDTLTPPTRSEADLAPSLLTENVRVSDAVSTLLNPLNVSLTESVLLDDIGQGATQLLGAIRVQDILTASLNPIQATPSESVLVTDSVSVALQLSAVAQENVRISDTLTAALQLAASATENILVTDALTPPTLGDTSDLSPPLLTENIRLDDIGQGQTQIIAPIRVQDVLTQPVLVDMGGGTLSPPLLTENVRVSDANESWAELGKDEFLLVSDTATVVLNPLRPAEAQENVRISDTVTVLLNPEQAQATEHVRISDTISVTLNPLQTAPQENVRVSDDLTANMALQATLSENLRVTDTVTTLLNPLQATSGESVLVSDTAATTLNPLLAALQENARVTDTAQASAGLTAPLSNENVRISDTVTAQLSLATERTEHVLVSDTPQALLVDQGTLNAPVLTEHVRVSDAVSAQITPLLVSLIEHVRVDQQGNQILGAGAAIVEIVRVVDVVEVTLNPLQTSLTEGVRVQDVRRSIGSRVRVRDVRVTTASATNVSVVSATGRTVSVVAATIRNVEVT